MPRYREQKEAQIEAIGFVLQPAILPRVSVIKNKSLSIEGEGGLAAAG